MRLTGAEFLRGKLLSVELACRDPRKFCLEVAQRRPGDLVEALRRGCARDSTALMLSTAMGPVPGL